MILITDYEVRRAHVYKGCGIWRVAYEKYFQGRYAHETSEFFDTWNQAMRRANEVVNA